MQESKARRETRFGMTRLKHVHPCLHMTQFVKHDTSFLRRRIDRSTRPSVDARIPAVRLSRQVIVPC